MKFTYLPLAGLQASDSRLVVVPRPATCLSFEGFEPLLGGGACRTLVVIGLLTERRPSIVDVPACWSHSVI